MSIQVSVTVFNRGSDPVSTPFNVKLTSDQGDVLQLDSAFQPVNTTIASGGSVTVSWNWVPHVADNVGQLRLLTDALGQVAESNELDNVTVRNVNITAPPPTPTYTCGPFDKPLITDNPSTTVVERLALGAKEKRTIPVKLQLIRNNLPATDYNLVPPPVISVAFTGSTSSVPVTVTADLANGSADDGNALRYDPSEQSWKFNLSTKNLSQAGTYTISIVSGDNSAYTVNPANCSIAFERK